MLLDKYLSNELIETYIGERCMKGLELWQELLKDFGTVSFRQFLGMHSLCFVKVKGHAVPLSEKFYILEHADNDILPLPLVHRIALFNSFADNSTVKETLLRLHDYVGSKAEASMTWALLKDGISELHQDLSPPVSEKSNLTLTVLKKFRRRRL